MATGLENLKIYTIAEELELRVFELTKHFPRDEKYRSVDQLRRSSSSVTNNIAESYNKRSLKEKVRILHDIVKSETEETRRNLDVCFKKGFHHDEEIFNRYTELMKAVSGYIGFLRNRPATYKLTNLSTYKLT
ncbi:MAG: four helix bundle protein [Patescibacteria group bacterium]